jgi:predicted RNA-binding protein Jag
MIADFTNYMNTIIEMTCGFKPPLKVVEPYPGTIQVWIEGTPDERALVMGRGGKTIEAFSRLAQIYARRHKYFIYIYVKPKSEIENNLDETIKLNMYL